MSAWISVKERLPEPTEWFVGLSQTRSINFDTGRDEIASVLTRGYPGQWVHRDFSQDELNGILNTWWMPLPPPPVTIPETELKF